LFIPKVQIFQKGLNLLLLVKNSEQRGNNHVDIFWTGGWDSTFRVLQLIVQKKKFVQPYYILDPKRKSAEAELNAIKAVELTVIEKFPYTKELLRPLIIENLDKICTDKVLLNSFVDITKAYNVGRQYSWLACYCDETGKKRVELSTQKPGIVYEQIVKDTKHIVEGNDSFYILEKDNNQSKLITLFQYFRFPLLEYTKIEMQEEAKDFGFDDILELSWFCHAPKWKKYKCGTCTPCITAIEQGLGIRVQFLGHLRYYLIVKTGLKNLREKLVK